MSPIFNACARVVKKIETQLGPIEVLVNDAMISRAVAEAAPVTWDFIKTGCIAASGTCLPSPSLSLLLASLPCRTRQVLVQRVAKL